MSTRSSRKKEAVEEEEKEEVVDSGEDGDSEKAAASPDPSHVDSSKNPAQGDGASTESQVRYVESEGDVAYDAQRAMAIKALSYMPMPLLDELFEIARKETTVVDSQLQSLKAEIRKLATKTKELESSSQVMGTVVEGYVREALAKGPGGWIQGSGGLVYVRVSDCPTTDLRLSVQEEDGSKTWCQVIRIIEAAVRDDSDKIERTAKARRFATGNFGRSKLTVEEGGAESTVKPKDVENMDAHDPDSIAGSEDEEPAFGGQQCLPEATFVPQPVPPSFVPQPMPQNFVQQPVVQNFVQQPVAQSFVPRRALERRGGGGGGFRAGRAGRMQRGGRGWQQGFQGQGQGHPGQGVQESYGQGYQSYPSQPPNFTQAAGNYREGGGEAAAGTGYSSSTASSEPPWRCLFCGTNGSHDLPHCRLALTFYDAELLKSDKVDHYHMRKEGKRYKRHLQQRSTDMNKKMKPSS